MGKERGHLPRLPDQAYRGMTCIHWIHTMCDRKTGWLDQRFHCHFRETLLHALVRFRCCCPMYCLMPDHIHLVSMGWSDRSDQKRATAFFRQHVKELLRARGIQLQRQAYDHVLRENERRPGAFEVIAEYVAQNPVRAGLISKERMAEYPHMGCLLPGYPDVSPWQKGYWETFWRIYHALRDGDRS